MAMITSEIQQKAQAIKLLILDVDGVLTNGELMIGRDGEVFKCFHSLDGHGIKLLQNAGIKTAIISARTSEAVSYRAKELGIHHLRQGVSNKYRAFSDLIDELAIQVEQTAYIGDDVIDLPVLLHCGFAVAVANAHDEVKARVDYITEKSGGNGAVREVCDLILKAQNFYDAMLSHYLGKNI